VSLTGSALSSAVLQAIIDDGDREIDAYLGQFNLSGSATGAIKSASLKLAQAGLLYHALQVGDLQAGMGEFASSVDVTRAAESLRKAAMILLEQFRDSQTSISAPHLTFVRRVDGR
jgi:hypothetical protein